MWVDRSKRSVCLIAAFVLGPAATANADWQFTRWGMSQPDLSDSSGGSTLPTTDSERAFETRSDGLQPTLKMPWRSGRFEFTAYFYFQEESSELVFVKLRLLDSADDTHGLLRRALELKYGLPERVAETRRLTTAVWRTPTDLVVQRRGPKGVVVTYEPLENKDNAGL